jgi:hypothetical protein
MAAEDRNGEVSTQAKCTGCSPRESSFDELAKELASGSISRGKVLRLMGAALVGGTLASLGIGEAAADTLCKPEGKKCRKDKQCCSGDCDDSSGKCAAAACVANGGTCTGATQCCSGNCSNGFCCASGHVGLSNGTCAKPCTSGFVDCPPCSQVCFPTSSLDSRYCSGGLADPLQECPNGIIDCPEGQFCAYGFGNPDRCAVAC